MPIVNASHGWGKRTGGPDLPPTNPGQDAGESDGAPEGTVKQALVLSSRRAKTKRLAGSDSCVAKVVRTHVRICLPSLEAKTDDFSVQLVSSRPETRAKTAEAAREARLNVQS